MYCVFSLRLSSWVGGSSSPYTSDLSQATQFTHEKALAFCRKHYDNQSGLGCVPVSLDDIAAVRSK